MTDLEEVEQWIMSFLVREGGRLTMIDPETGLGPSMSSDSGYGRAGWVVDMEGRLYIHLPSVINKARMTLGQNISQKTLAASLKMMKFELLEKVSVYERDLRSQISIWVSPAGFLPDEVIPGKLIEGKGHSIEDDSLERAPSSIEEAAKEARERIECQVIAPKELGQGSQPGESQHVDS